MHSMAVLTLFASQKVDADSVKKYIMCEVSFRPIHIFAIYDTNYSSKPTNQMSICLKYGNTRSN